jgi:hypothetical protein
MPLDAANWFSDDTAQVATGLGTEQRRQAGETPAPSETDEVTALLIRARGYLERGWCRWAMAMGAYGYTTHPESDVAVAWCAYGALRAAGLNDRGFAHHPVLVVLRAAIGGGDITLFNDSQETVEPVLAAFDRAIAAVGR